MPKYHLRKLIYRYYTIKTERKLCERQRRFGIRRNTVLAVQCFYAKISDFQTQYACRRRFPPPAQSYYTTKQKFLQEIFAKPSPYVAIIPQASRFKRKILNFNT